MRCAFTLFSFSRTYTMTPFEHKIFYGKSLNHFSLHFSVGSSRRIDFNLVSLSLSLFANTSIAHAHKNVISGLLFYFIFCLFQSCLLKDTYFILIFLKSNLVMGSMRCHSLCTTAAASLPPPMPSPPNHKNNK